MPSSLPMHGSKYRSQPCKLHEGAGGFQGVYGFIGMAHILLGHADEDDLWDQVDAAESGGVLNYLTVQQLVKEEPQNVLKARQEA
jgi:hypothetical protein